MGCRAGTLSQTRLSPRLPFERFLRHEEASSQCGTAVCRHGWFAPIRKTLGRRNKTMHPPLLHPWNIQRRPDRSSPTHRPRRGSPVSPILYRVPWLSDNPALLPGLDTRDQRGNTEHTYIHYLPKLQTILPLRCNPVHIPAQRHIAFQCGIGHSGSASAFLPRGKRPRLLHTTYMRLPDQDHIQAHLPASGLNHTWPTRCLSPPQRETVETPDQNLEADFHCRIGNNVPGDRTRSTPYMALGYSVVRHPMVDQLE